MPILLQVQEIAKEYGGQEIFSGLSFTVSGKQKIGVIGKNGAGKSTLFRLIVGQEKADSGQLLIHPDANIGYLEQEDGFLEEENALAYLERKSGRPEWRARQLASRFELGPDKLSLPAKSLSGGWSMRLRLIAMLLSEPNLFLLDEPSNYLDLETLLLLEEYLRSYRGSFLIISHDREFLKQTCRETLEISKSGCYHYPGDIEAYLAFKEQKLATLIKANESLERQQEHWQEFIDRFRFKASKAKQAQALVRKISKLEEKRIKIEHQAGITRIIIPPTERSRNFALKIDNLSIGYPEKIVAKHIDFDVRTGEKLAILGLNGTGKTTLIRTLNGNLAPLSGSFRFASGSRIACHGQEEISSLNPQEQAGDFLRRLASSEIKTEAVLKMAGDFLFREEALKKTISVLSGGEKSRLLLAGLLLSRPDVLILDEPTCHLDFETTEALAAGLSRWNGTVIFASHDRTFTALVATGIVSIKDESARRLFEDYQDYVASLEKEVARKQAESSATQAEKEERNSALNREKYLEKKARHKQLRALEKDIQAINAYKNELLAYFLEHYHDYRPEKVAELEEVKRHLADKEDLWLILSAEKEGNSS